MSHRTKTSSRPLPLILQRTKVAVPAGEHLICMSMPFGPFGYLMILNMLLNLSVGIVVMKGAVDRWREIRQV